MHRRGRLWLHELGFSALGKVGEVGINEGWGKISFRDRAPRSKVIWAARIPALCKERNGRGARFPGGSRKSEGGLLRHPCGAALRFTGEGACPTRDSPNLAPTLSKRIRGDPGPAGGGEDCVFCVVFRVEDGTAVGLTRRR